MTKKRNIELKLEKIMEATRQLKKVGEYQKLERNEWRLRIFTGVSKQNI